MWRECKNVIFPIHFSASLSCYYVDCLTWASTSGRLNFKMGKRTSPFVKEEPRRCASLECEWKAPHPSCISNLDSYPALSEEQKGVVHIRRSDMMYAWTWERRKDGCLTTFHWSSLPPLSSLFLRKKRENVLPKTTIIMPKWCIQRYCPVLQASTLCTCDSSSACWGEGRRGGEWRRVRVFLTRLRV